MLFDYYPTGKTFDENFKNGASNVLRVENLKKIVLVYIENFMPYV